MGVLCCQAVLVKSLSYTPGFLVLSCLHISTFLSVFAEELLSYCSPSENRKSDLSPPLVSPDHCTWTHPLASPTGSGRIIPALLLGPPLPFHMLEKCSHAVITLSSLILSSPSTQSPPSACHRVLTSPILPASVPFCCMFSKQNVLNEWAILHVATSSPPFPPRLFSWTFTLKWLLSPMTYILQKPKPSC